MSTYNSGQLNRILHGWRVINLLPPTSFFSIFFLLLCFDVYFHLILWLIFLLRKLSLFIKKMHLQKTLIIGLILQTNQIPLICFDRERRVDVSWVGLWCFLQHWVILRGKKEWFDLIKIRSILDILKKKWKCA